jgi:hypothetical protein
MSNIPDHDLRKISKQSTLISNSYTNDYPEQLKIKGSYFAGSEYGYSLAQEALEKKDKEIEKWKAAFDEIYLKSNEHKLYCEVEELINIQNNLVAERNQYREAFEKCQQEIADLKEKNTRLRRYLDDYDKDYAKRHGIA